MKITLVDPTLTADPALGLGYLASYLHKRARDVSVSIIETDRDVAERVLDTAPDLVGFTTVTANYSQVLNSVRDVRSKSDVPIALGGPHITALPESMPAEADIAVLGEGEATLLELVELFNSAGDFSAGRLGEIDGLAFWANGGLVKTNPREFIEPLDSIPMPDRGLFDMKRYLKPAMRDGAGFTRATTQLSARGCPYKCAFCHPSLVWRKVRMFTPEYVAEELNFIVRKYKLQSVLMSDDLFIMDPTRLEMLIELLGKRGILGKFKIFCETRPNLVTDRSVKLLKLLNVVEVGMGIESASPRILKYMKKGSASVEKNREAVELMRSNGINVYAFVIIGAPTETRAEMMETLRFVSLPAVTRFSVAIATPFPGTELWDYALEKGLVSLEMDWRRIFAQPVPGRPQPVYLNSDTLPYEDFLEVYKMFEDAKNVKWIQNTLPRLSIHHLGALSKRVISDPKAVGRLAGRVGRYLGTTLGQEKMDGSNAGTGN